MVLGAVSRRVEGNGGGGGVDQGGWMDGWMDDSTEGGVKCGQL